MAEDEFTPKLGKPRARGSKSGKRYAHQVLAAVNRAGGRAARKSGAGLGRIGRGGAPAAALAGRGRSSSRSAAASSSRRASSAWPGRGWTRRAPTCVTSSATA